MARTDEQLEAVKALLGEQNCLTLATAGADGEPWATPLFYFADVLDEKLCLYWVSSESSSHSLNLERTPRVSAPVYRHATSWREIRGVQMRGLASKVTDAKRRRAVIKAYCERLELGTVFRLAIWKSALYEFQPEFFRFIDNAKGFGSRFELARGAEGWVGE